MFLAVLPGLVFFEYYGKVVERGLGYYLKWQNPGRPQLGRIWDRDRQAVVAQDKIQSIRSSLHSREESTLAAESIKHLLEQVEPSFPLVLTRGRFIQLYYDFPGQWPGSIISAYDLLLIDADETWARVLLNRNSSWITISFIDEQNIPVHEVFLSLDLLGEIESARVIRRGTLEENGFSSEKIFPVSQFLPILRTLDPDTRKAVFPDPRWFLENNYHITRIGAMESRAVDASSHDILLGVEYDTDYYSSVLTLHVPVEIANNMLSQIERTESEILGDVVPLLPDMNGEVH